MTSRSKRKRLLRARNVSGAAEAFLDGRNRASVLRTLSAAAMSPKNRGALVSIGNAIATSFLFKDRTDGRDLQPHELHALLELTDARTEGIEAVQDYIALDSALAVRVGHRGNRYRIHPGSYERPLALVRRAQMVAAIVDPTLKQELGFGIADVLELLLRHMDATIRQAEPSWSDLSGTPEIGVAKVTAVEVVAAERYPTLRDAAEACEDGAVSNRVLNFVTQDSRALSFNPASGDSPFGAVFAVRADGCTWSLPCAFLLESFSRILSDLSARALRAAPRLALDFHQSALSVAMKTMANFDPAIPLASSVGSDISIGITKGNNEWIAIALISSLGADGVEGRFSEARQLLEYLRPGSELSDGQGVKSIVQPTDRLTRILVLASVAPFMLLGFGKVARLTLEDLEWIGHASKDRDDFLLFARDLCCPPLVDRCLAFEAIGTWESWRANECCLHRDGRPTSILVAPHGGDVEWVDAAKSEQLDGVLHQFGLPPKVEWDRVEEEDVFLRLQKLTPGVGLLIRAEEPAVCIEIFSGDSVPQNVKLLDSIAGAILWNISRLTSASSFLAQLRIPQLLVVLKEDEPTPETLPLRLAETEQSHVIRIAWDLRLSKWAETFPGRTEETLGDVLLSGIRSLAPQGMDDVFEDFRAAWRALPRSFSVNSESVPQTVTDLDVPLASHAAFESGLLRRLATMLYDRRVGGSFRGRAASKLVGETIYPFVSSELEAECNSFSRLELLLFASHELERNAYRRYRARRGLRWNVESMPVAYDPAAAANQFEREASVALRSLQLVVETVLRIASPGIGSPESLRWRHILSVAQVAVRVAVQSEAAQYGLQPMEIEVGSGGKVDFGAGPGSVDLDRYNHDSAESALDPEPRERPDVQGTLEAVDPLFFRIRGYRLSTLLSVIARVRSFPGARRDQPTVVATRDQLFRFLSDIPDATANEIEAAIHAVTLTGSDLRAATFEPWEFAKRDVRLVTRPLILVDSNNYLVLPWFSGESLAVYLRYLGDARLPWPPDSLEPEIASALTTLRSSRNIELEREVERLVDTLHLPCRSRVAKAKTVGLVHLSGEIDLLAADVASKTIWVLEAKDPSEAFSVADIDRSVRRFHAPKAYIDRLLVKVEDVQRDPSAVARALGIVGAHSWTVRPLIVTRRIVHAAYVQSPRVPFATLRTLRSFLRSAPT